MPKIKPHQSHTHMLTHLSRPQPRLDLAELAAQIHFEQATIIGNAPGAWQPAAVGTTFVFNGTQYQQAQANLAQAELNASQLINIANGGFADSQYAFEVHGHEQGALLARALTQVATELTPQLGCWPSSGLTTIALMVQLANTVTVQRMSLLPSLQRTADLATAHHLPCLVHNWLGERRLAKALFSHRLAWDEFALLPVEIESPHTISNDNPFLLLDVLRQNPVDAKASLQLRQEQLNALIALSQTPTSTWLSYAQRVDLTDYEALFFNHMPETKPSYWFLMDYEASHYLDIIRHQLAYCQQIADSVLFP